MTRENLEVFSVGHSNHTFERFLELLEAHGIQAVADVRSQPVSRWSPQFSRPALEKSLRAAGIHYVFLGRELGARASDPGCYENGRVVYGRIAATEGFRLAIQRVLEGARKMRVALLCAEAEPLECHRTILVARHLVEAGVQVRHILPGGGLETQEESLRRLKAQLGLPEQDLFVDEATMNARAYLKQEEKIAYRQPVAAEIAEPDSGQEQDE